MLAMYETWHKEEEKHLKQAVWEHGTSKWEAVKVFMQTDRTVGQLRSKWKKLARATNETWHAEEIKRLKQAVEKYGTSNWEAVKTFMQTNHTRGQLRSKWRQMRDDTGTDTLVRDISLPLNKRFDAGDH